MWGNSSSSRFAMWVPQVLVLAPMQLSQEACMNVRLDTWPALTYPCYHAGPLMTPPWAALEALGTAVLALLTVLTSWGLRRGAGESSESHSCRANVTGLTDTYSPCRKRNHAFSLGDWPTVAFSHRVSVNLCNMSWGDRHMPSHQQLCGKCNLLH